VSKYFSTGFYVCSLLIYGGLAPPRSPSPTPASRLRLRLPGQEV
jgi:hypothetical protein